MCSTSARSARSLRSGSLDRPALAEDHDRAVVHRVVKRGAREHQPVEQRDREAHRHAVGERSEQPAERRAVQVHAIAVARVQHRDHERLPVVADDAEVADHALVENRVDRGPPVVAAAGAAPHLRALSFVIVHSHRCSRTISRDPWDDGARNRRQRRVRDPGRRAALGRRAAHGPRPGRRAWDQPGDRQLRLSDAARARVRGRRGSSRDPGGATTGPPSPRARRVPSPSPRPRGPQHRTGRSCPAPVDRPGAGAHRRRRKLGVSRLEAADPDLLDAARSGFEADGVPAEALAVVSGAMDGVERVLGAICGRATG